MRSSARMFMSLSVVDSIGYFFLKILKADISRKRKFLFSNASARRTAPRLAMDIYGLIAPLLQFLMGAPNRSVRRRGRRGDGVQVLWRRDRSAAVKLVFNIRWRIHRAGLDLLGSRCVVRARP